MSSATLGYHWDLLEPMDELFQPFIEQVTTTVDEEPTIDDAVYYSEGVPRQFVIVPCLPYLYRNMERIASDFASSGDRILVHSERIQYEEIIMHIEYITTRISYSSNHHGWCRQSVCYVEGYESPYPYDIDLIHSEGEFQGVFVQ